MVSNPTPARAWRQSGDTAWRCDPWFICRVVVRGKESFELWNDKQPHAVAFCGSFDEAKTKAKEMESSK